MFISAIISQVLVRLGVAQRATHRSQLALKAEALECEPSGAFMATYAKASYNAAKYAANRPTYPRQLFEFVFRYHERGTKARFDTAIDLGCGPGKHRILSSRAPYCADRFQVKRPSS